MDRTMTLEYKNYLGSVEFDEERQLLWGRVLNTRDVITYEAESGPFSSRNLRSLWMCI